jgi:formate-dependent nitrite reductase membrane component NrfD
MPQHFVAPPQWGWYIVWYFFLGGLAGGAYALGTVLRLFRDPRDEPVARIAFVLSFLAMAVCPVLLTLDLGQPGRFWHMLADPSTSAVNFKAASPMSVGVWLLLFFGLFASVSFADALAGRRLLGQAGLSRGFHGIGALLGLGLAGYTGVLLSVSNQPLWSDTWALGGLFLASGLSVSAASLGLVASWRRVEAVTARKLWRVDGYFLAIELLLLVVFFATLGQIGPRYVQGPWLLLWLLVLAGILVPLAMHFRTAASAGAAAFGALLVLAGGLALRIAVVFGAQA